MQALEALLSAEEVVVDRADQVLRAVRAFGDGKADFADCLIERIASCLRAASPIPNATYAPAR